MSTQAGMYPHRDATIWEPIFVYRCGIKRQDISVCQLLCQTPDQPCSQPGIPVAFQHIHADLPHAFHGGSRGTCRIFSYMLYYTDEHIICQFWGMLWSSIHTPSLYWPKAELSFGSTQPARYKPRRLNRTFYHTPLYAFIQAAGYMVCTSFFFRFWTNAIGISFYRFKDVSYPCLTAVRINPG